MNAQPSHPHHPPPDSQHRRQPRRWRFAVPPARAVCGPSARFSSPCRKQQHKNTSRPVETRPRTCRRRTGAGAQTQPAENQASAHRPGASAAAPRLSAAEALATAAALLPPSRWPPSRGTSRRPPPPAPRRGAAAAPLATDGSLPSSASSSTRFTTAAPAPPSWVRSAHGTADGRVQTESRRAQRGFLAHQ